MRLLIKCWIFKNNKIVNIFATDDGLLLQTQYSGFYKLIAGNVVKFATEVDSEIASSSVYSSQQLSDKGFAIGTVSNGIFVVVALSYGIVKQNVIPSPHLLLSQI